MLNELAQNLKSAEVQIEKNQIIITMTSINVNTSFSEKPKCYPLSSQVSILKPIFLNRLNQHLKTSVNLP